MINAFLEEEVLNTTIEIEDEDDDCDYTYYDDEGNLLPKWN